MTITLASEQEAQVHQLLEEGYFTSPEEAVNAVLAQALGPVPKYSSAEIAEIQQGVDEADRGELVSQEDVESFFEDWRRNG